MFFFSETTGISFRFREYPIDSMRERFCLQWPVDLVVG